MEHLGQYRIPGLPSSIYYIANFISPKEEQSILQKIPANRWISLSNRRLQAVPTQLSAKNALLASPLPSWLIEPVVSRIHQLDIFKDAPHGINHCLINEYLPGQGIMPHEDGAAYYPIVATVSLQSSIVLEVASKNADDIRPESRWRILQEPRSLLLTTGSAYADTLHGISEVTEDVDLNNESVANWRLLADRQAIENAGGRQDRTTRISLTLRDVQKVVKLGGRFGGSR